VLNIGRLFKRGEAEDRSSNGSFAERFDPHEVLGVGPLGRIYMAVEKPSGRKVAFRGFKRPKHADGRHWQQAIRRYTEELAAAQKLDHPNIARLYEFGEEDGTYYVVSEWFEGEALQRKIDRRQEFTSAQALEWIDGAGQALDYAASIGVYHGDITPYNLVITSGGEAKIVNFGLAHTRPKADSVYRAPEELNGHEGDPRSDLFHLGLVLYHLLSGEHPFGAGVWADVQARILRQPTPPLPGLDPRLQAALNRLLEKDVERRAQRWSELAHALLDRELTSAEMPRLQLPVRPSDAPSLAHYSLGHSDVESMSDRLRLKREEPGEGGMV